MDSEVYHALVFGLKEVKKDIEKLKAKERRITKQIKKMELDEYCKDQGKLFENKEQ